MSLVSGAVGSTEELFSLVSGRGGCVNIIFVFKLKKKKIVLAAI